MTMTVTPPDRTRRPGARTVPSGQPNGTRDTPSPTCTSRRNYTTALVQDESHSTPRPVSKALTTVGPTGWVGFWPFQLLRSTTFMRMSHSRHISEWLMKRPKRARFVAVVAAKAEAGRHPFELAHLRIRELEVEGFEVLLYERGRLALWQCHNAALRLEAHQNLCGRLAEGVGDAADSSIPKERWIPWLATCGVGRAERRIGGEGDALFAAELEQLDLRQQGMRLDFGKIVGKNRTWSDPFSVRAVWSFAA